MIRKPSRQSATRLTCGVLVAAASAFTVGVGLADSANAAGGTITATPAASTIAQHGSTTIAVSAAGATAANDYLAYTIAGPDANATPQYVSTSGTSGTITLTNGGTAGDDVVTVYDTGADTGSAAPGTVPTEASVPGNAATTATVHVASVPTNLSVSPTTGASTTTAGVDKSFTVTASTATGVAPNASVTVTATETVPTGTAGTANSPVHLTTTGGATESGDTVTGTTATDSIVVTTGLDGKATFTATSTIAGTVNITATPTGGTGGATAALTVTGGAIGNDAVSTITATPTTNTRYTGHGSATYTVDVKDASGNPVKSATVDYVITGGPDFAALGGVANTFGVTSPTGELTGPVPGLGTTAGTDNITFYVNHTNPGSSSDLPDGSDPTAAVTATFANPPTYTTATLSTPKATLQAGSTAAVPFSVTVKNGATPVAGVVVDFSETGTAVGGTTTTAQATTDASGVATVNVTPTTATDGQTLVVSASINTVAVTGSPQTVTYHTPVASTFTLTPAAQSVAAGGTVTATAKVVDQFGNGVAGQVISYTVAGRNPTTSAKTVTTGADGTATISYTDAGTFAIGDTITATDTTTALGTKTATVNYPTGGVAPGNLTVTGPAVAAETVNATAVQTVTATVTNGNGLVLANSPVTFTVNNGFVTTDAAPTATPTTTSVTVNTDGTGVATAYVGSTKSGAQVATVSAGTLSKTAATVTYATGTPTTVSLAPATAKIVPGQEQKYTATEVDQFGNGINGAAIQFVQTGPGNLSGASSQTVTTAPDGTASVTLSLPTGATVGGTGTVVATSINNAVTGVAAVATGAGFTPSASATYTVQGPQPSTVALAFGSTNVVGKAGTVTATVTNTDGSPAVGVTVHFTLTGADSVTGTAATGSNGVATFAYTPTKSGAVSATAFADTNSNGTQDSGEPSGTANATVTSAPKKVEKPSITLQSHTKGWVHVTVNTNPNLANKHVAIYQVIGGKAVLKATVKTGPGGNATHTFKGLKKGSKVSYKAIGLAPGYTEHFSATKTIRVKK